MEEPLKLGPVNEEKLLILTHSQHKNLVFLISSWPHSLECNKVKWTTIGETKGNNFQMLQKIEI